MANNNPYPKQSRYSSSNNDQEIYPDFVDLSNYNNNNEYSIDSTNSKTSNIQLSISTDEFCRNIDNIEDQQTFIFNKVHGSKHHVAPPAHKTNKKTRQSNLTNYIISRSPNINTINSSNRLIQSPIINCKFPKWLNKKWQNLKQTKLFSLEYKLDSLLVFDQKNSIVINKYTCSHMKSRKSNYVQAIVKSLNGWYVKISKLLSKNI
jgi:hypothetical protein